MCASATRSRKDLPLCTIHAEAMGELAYALGYADTNPDIVQIAET